MNTASNSIPSLSNLNGGMLSSILGGGNSAIASLLGNSAGNSATSPLFGGGNSAIASLLGNTGSSAIASLLGNTGNSAIASLLGNSGSSAMSSLLGGGSSGIASLLGNSGGDSKTQLILNLMQQQQIAAQQAANKEPVNIGIQEPSFVPTPAPRKPNPFLCNILMTKMQDSNEKLSSLMRMQYIQGGCLNELFSNPLALLRDGALDQVKEILGCLNELFSNPLALLRDGAL